MPQLGGTQPDQHAGPSYTCNTCCACYASTTTLQAAQANGQYVNSKAGTRATEPQLLFEALQACLLLESCM